MAKPLNEKDRERINYKIERVSPVMSREELNNLYNEFKSDDDYVNFHVDNIEDTHNRYLVTIMNDESKSPVKGMEDDGRSYGFMKVKDALDYVNEYIDEGRCNSKLKAVMQNGYSKKSVDKYNQIVEQEKNESVIVNDFAKPSFEELMNNIYMNDYNGTIYNQPDEYLPDELREDVGVIIPGLIESREEYFEFVKRLKDRGKNGLGRSIYSKYEEYEDAVDLIDQYKEALFNKYGGKEEFFYAKEMGGVFGAYEYYPTIKPRFKKTQRNIKLSRGVNLNELAMVEDMGRRIREELNDEIESVDVEYEYTVYEETPPKFKDLPEDLKIFYKTDKNGINGFSYTDKFKTLEQYANDLIRQKNDPEKQLEGYRILEEIEKEELFGAPMYESEFVNIVDEDNLTTNAMLNQLQYDKIMYETKNDVLYADNIVDSTEAVKAYKTFVKNQIMASGKYDEEELIDKTKVSNMVEHATNYLFNATYRKVYEEREKVNSAGDVLYRENKEINFGPDGKDKIKSNESKVKHYVNEIIDSTRHSITSAESNADNVNAHGTSLIDVHECSYDKTIGYGSMFGLEAEPSQVLKYMKNNESFAKRVYEMGSDVKVGNLFSERTNIDDFVEEITKSTKPMITEELIDKALQNNRKVGN